MQPGCAVICGKPRIAAESIREACQLGPWLFKGISGRAISCTSSYVPHGGCQSNCAGSGWGC